MFWRNTAPAPCSFCGAMKNFFTVLPVVEVDVDNMVYLNSEHTLANENELDGTNSTGQLCVVNYTR